MKHENEPEGASDGMCMCNFCDELYDPYDRHTCKGNDILPKKRPKAVEEEYTPLTVGKWTGEIKETFRAQTDANWKRDNEINGSSIRFDGDPSWVINEFGHPVPAVSALATQQGGDHYRKLPIQPVEYIIANGIGFLAGNVIKYASRYKDKGGAEDIRKIKHYCDLILEFEYKETK